MEAQRPSPVRYASLDRAYGQRLASTAPQDDGPIWMVNLMHYRATADYADGRGTTITGREADDRYAPMDSLRAVGAEVVLLADVEDQLLGDAPRWDRIGVVKYPTRRAFIEMQSRPDFVAKHVHKEAGMAQTIVMGCVPRAVPELADAGPDWSSVPHPPSLSDGPVLVLHVLRFHADGADADMAAYQASAGRVAIPHGVRIGGWFDVEGTILGDGRSWDQVRFNAFPSKAAFMAVALDRERLAAQHAHREPAIADTYTMILRPVVDDLAGSISRWRAEGRPISSSGDS